MPLPERIARLFLAAAAGVGTLLVVPGRLGPTLAVVVFVVICFLLRCAVIHLTFAFAALVAFAPIPAFAIGASSHAPLAESIWLSLTSYLSQPRLIATFLVGPLVVGGLTHLLLSRVRARRGEGR